MQIIAVLADVLEGHDVGDAVSAAWSLLGNRLGAHAGVADPSPEYLGSLHRRWPTGLGPGPTAVALRRCRRADRLRPFFSPAEAASPAKATENWSLGGINGSGRRSRAAMGLAHTRKRLRAFSPDNVTARQVRAARSLDGNSARRRQRTTPPPESSGNCSAVGRPPRITTGNPRTPVGHRLASRRPGWLARRTPRATPRP
jgi:hypothetical protein